MNGDPEVLGAALEDLRDHGYQPSYNGRPSCPFCYNFIDDEETHEPGCVLLRLDTARDSRPVGEGLDVDVLTEAWVATCRKKRDRVKVSLTAREVAEEIAAEYARFAAAPTRDAGQEAAVRPATEDRWFRDNEDDPERHCYRTEDGDEVVVYASREQAEAMIAALSGAAVRPVEREGLTDGA